MGSCAVSRPLTYASVERPTGPIESTSNPEQKFTVGKAGFMYRPPADTEKIFNEAENRSDSEVLRNFDILYSVGTCYIVVCFGNDFIIMNNPDPDWMDYSKL